MAPTHDPSQITSPLDVGRQALWIGGGAALPGTIIGAFYGTLRTSTPTLFALASGAQWFTLGSVYYTFRTSLLNTSGLQNWFHASRGAPLHARTDLAPSSADKLRASTIAGALTGSSLGLAFRGPRNVLPGTLMFSLFGWVGQRAYLYFDERNSAGVEGRAEARGRGEEVVRENFMQKIAKSRWSPMSVLTDEQYEEMMREKLLKVDAEIAILDERIEVYRQRAREAEVKRAVAEKVEEKK